MRRRKIDSVVINLILLTVLLYECRLTCSIEVSCSNKRMILTNQTGIISDGSGDYPMNSHCEWLIKAKHPKKYISLKFYMLNTECCYDFIFVYDGSSYNSRLLGSFSGSSIPDVVFAESGSMLLFLYSDTNYVLKGFEAVYSIDDCPLNCNQHGSCNNGICRCYMGWSGRTCSIELCPQNCNSHCKTKLCSCNSDYTGEACFLDPQNIKFNTWHNLSSTMHSEPIFTARTSHTGIYISHTNSLWIFGGYNLEKALGDLILYNFSTAEWKTVEQRNEQPWPTARYQHAISEYNGNFVIFGGILDNGSFSDELWFFNTSCNEWYLLAGKSSIKPEARAGHTLTLVDDDKLYLFGGRFFNQSYCSDMYYINLKMSSTWQKIETIGGKELDRRSVGHSAVYHRESKTIYVYGGFKVDSAKFSNRSNILHAFNVQQNYWSRIYYPEEVDSEAIPKVRAYHSAVIIGSYMLVYGGNVHIHNTEEMCFDNSLYLYHLRCQRWVNLTKLTTEFPAGLNEAPRIARFSHIAAVKDKNVLLISGGYNGAVLGDLIAYIIPPTISQSSNVGGLSPCYYHDKSTVCQDDPECIWCVSPVSGKNCQPSRHRADLCSGEYTAGPCLGICAVLKDCYSCMAQGQGIALDSRNSSLTEPCAWVVQEEVCQRHQAQASSPLTIQPQTSVYGWWGKNNTRVISMEDCRMLDMPPGLTIIKYNHPKNTSYPDEVSIVRETHQQLHYTPSISAENLHGDYFTELRGFIHPTVQKMPTKYNISLTIGVTAGTARLNISSDDTPRNSKMVAQLTNNKAEYLDRVIFGKNGSLFFPNLKENSKYFISFEIMQQYQQSISPSFPTSSMVLSMQSQALTAPFLEPFSGGNCENYKNCLMCVTDSGCGWCEAHHKCMFRALISNPKQHCISNNVSRLLITRSQECNMCKDFIDCQSCVESNVCEWFPAESHCVRPGRLSEVIIDVKSCPVGCYMHKNCTSCVTSANECAWCPETQTCFPFYSYVPAFTYGQCDQWVDNVSDASCSECFQHKTCEECFTQIKCGWCGNYDNPTIGVCVSGDFKSPYGPLNCSVHLNEFHKTINNDLAIWSYGTCPDVEECRLGLHDCHPNATCINTPESFICFCKKGFKGDGKEICNKTCYDDCVHGKCSESPDFKCLCDLGWTGVDCSVNCGCNNHSTCVNGVNLCDNCESHTWTEGKFCEMCRPGSFGNAVSHQGCHQCECNGHGNISLGNCNRESGVCFCIDNTYGDNCDKCLSGFYGNPRNGGQCYHQCDGRTILHNVRSSGLGSYTGKSVIAGRHTSCLWILTIFPELKSQSSASLAPTITFTIQADIVMKCPENFVYVYDGIPGFVAGKPSGHDRRLGVFCGLWLGEPITVEATSGQITVYFESINTLQGFNATFQVNQCPDLCRGNRVCVNGRCQCINGFSGVNCDIEICPHNCSVAARRGFCDQDLNLCRCFNGFGGPDCSKRITPALFKLESILDPAVIPHRSIPWHYLQRAGHTLLADNSKNLWLYGGYSPSHGPHTSLLMFNTSTNVWSIASPTEETKTFVPLARYLHAAAYVPSMFAFYILGGIVDNNITIDFWKFHIDRSLWLPLPTPGIPPMAGHTFTLRVDGDDESLLLIGGFSAVYGFSHKTYEFFPRNGDWRELYVTGTVPAGIYGHSTVYHAPTKSFYIFGGYLYKEKRPIISDELYAFHYPKQKWTVLPPNKFNKPLPRLFHAAVTTNDLMIIIGGRSRTIDFTNVTMIYKYACNNWYLLTDSNYRTTGAKLPAVVGPDAAILNGSIYIMGGFNGVSSGQMFKLRLIDDLCKLNTENQRCLQATGCTLCVNNHPNSGNKSAHCYINKSPTPYGCSETVGADCSRQTFERTNCSQFKTCRECLAAWPSHLNAEPVCRWCNSCVQARCVTFKEDCTKNMCSAHNHIIVDAEDCSDRICSATDCEKCMDMGHCNWTRLLKLNGDSSFQPEYDWNCYLKSSLTSSHVLNPSIPPNSCPRRCYQERQCSFCLNSTGGEGGWQKCYWSEKLRECMTPSYVLLRCMTGECGLILQGDSSECRQSCTVYTQCSQCLKHAGCGWCAFGGMNGLGVCMPGGIQDPIKAYCSENNISINDEFLPDNAISSKSRAKGSPTWAFVTCPQEDECLNGHHTCNHRSEVCVDTPESFHCECGAGYTQERDRCKPICQQGCNNGECVDPNVCRCSFGYVGYNCSTACACHGHSNCPGVNDLATCLKCHNNTKGSQCEQCQPLFVGDAKTGPCLPCLNYCHGHTKVCLSTLSFKEFLNQSKVIPERIVDASLPYAIADLASYGPNSTEAICVNCGNYTQGDTCDVCKPGYFRLSRDSKDTRDLRDPCIICQCNGHSDTCTPNDGLNCNCQNNTETECGRKENGSEIPCWRTQCSKCKEYFLGKPTDGHQCYRQMTVEKDYCLDPISHRECLRYPQPLLQSRTVFFAVPPKYLNVDIRITIDITEGGVDVYFSPKEDTFVVDVNHSNGEHLVSIDKNYTYIPVNDYDDEPFPFSSSRSQRSVKDLSFIRNTTRHEQPKYRLEYRRAKGLNTFVTIMRENTFLVVKNLQYRLVITLPLEIHNLKTNRFYLILRGTADHRATFGNIFFRQDQPHIDLFVFFSVFFSCFFLFLALCVVVWKVKQAFDVRRARHQHAIEMQNMASRPFAQVFIAIDDIPDEIILRPVKFCRNGHTGEYFQQESKISVRPIALESTDDGIAAVGTVLLELPGGNMSPVRMCLGSALVTMRLNFPSIPSCNSIKCSTRRRLHTYT